MGAVQTGGKRALETFFVGLGLDRLGLRFRRGRTAVLAYHNIVPDDHPGIGDVSLHLRVSDFARQLDVLCQFGRVLPLDDVLASGLEAQREANTFAITFDDGYRGAVALGVRELARFGLPATIFVAPALLGDRTFWWDAIPSETSARAPTLRDRILNEANGTHEEAERLVCDSGLRMQQMPKYSRSAAEAELREAAQVAGIRIGSHTWSHASLVRLSGYALEQELTRPRDWLRERFGEAYLDILSYPYGFHSARVRQATRDAGYRAGLGLVRGSVRLDDLQRTHGVIFRLPRLNVPSGLSTAGFRIKAAWA